jgi:hypothetical protein
MSNNSVACDDIRDLHEYFWDTYSPDNKGNPREPYGLVNLRLSRKVGRLGEDEYPDPEVQGYNPCAEQSLAPYETCCLAEIFLPNITSREEFFDLIELLYRVNKHSLLIPCHHPETDQIVHQNMRMGIGLTGILQASKEQLSWMSDGYIHLRNYDERYSELKDLNTSIKLTTVKPSGTLSLLPGVTPGVHPGYSQYMVRRIRIAAGHELVEVCRKHGYPVEYQKDYDGKDDYNTVVVTFPFAYPEGTILADQMTAMEQLKWIKRLQTEWSDNSVSCTIYYKKEELPEIKDYLLKHYRNNHKSLSFLLHNEHGFTQAPYEAITKEQYDELVASTTIITSISSAQFEGGDECATGACPVR